MVNTNKDIESGSSHSEETESPFSTQIDYNAFETNQKDEVLQDNSTQLSFEEMPVFVFWSSISL